MDKSLVFNDPCPTRNRHKAWGLNTAGRKKHKSFLEKHTLKPNLKEINKKSHET
jgi:hypothetical protein